MSKNNIFIFIICVCIGGLLSLWLGQDTCFDLRNYHLYVPYAFLNGRDTIDLLAAGPIHTFFNPLPDIPYYLIFSYFYDWPQLTGFLAGSYYGILLFVLYQWVTKIITGNNLSARCLRASTCIFALTGIAAFWQIGMFTNEELVAVFAVWAAYLLFCGTDERFGFQLKYLAEAAFLVSFAGGLKYTAVPAVAGVGVCCLFLLIKNKASYKAYLCVMGAALAGFLLADGCFLWQKWKELGNPLFPYFNHIFKSPFFPPEALPNSPYVPQGWKERLFLPFLRLNFFDSEYRLDFRMLLGFISFILFCAGGLFYIKKRPLSKPYVLLLGLFIGTYIPWVLLFGNIRYAVFLEILSCLLFTCLLLRFIPAKFLFILLIGLSVYTAERPFPRWPRKNFSAQNITFSQPVFIEDGSLVVVGGHFSFLIPFLNPNARYIGGINFQSGKISLTRAKRRFLAPLQKLDYQHHFPVREEIRKHRGQLYLLVPYANWIWDNDFWKDYGIDISGRHCQVFRTNFVIHPFFLCTVKKAVQ